tara:strand:- start:3330 stop:4373 length:1044 start_codon:yes stop_codon:yes gene_type:complete
VYHKEIKAHENKKSCKQIIAVTMATSRQGLSVVEQLSESGKYHIRAITRNTKSTKALAIGSLPNVKLIKGDLTDQSSLKAAFKDVDVIFGNTTPTKGWKIFRGSIVRDYEIQQGLNLINEVKNAYSKGKLNHFIFSSICKPKIPLYNDPAPGHFTSKWDIEQYLENEGLSKITTIIRPVSYYENFENKIPGYSISKTIFPGIVGKDFKWQTIAVNDVGKWVNGILSRPQEYKNQSINIASEELTGAEMAKTLEKVVEDEGLKTKYLMIPRIAIKLLENDIGIMADWIERTGYGANMKELKRIQKELGIIPTSLESWLKIKLNKQKSTLNIRNNNWKVNTLNLQLDKQ